MNIANALVFLWTLDISFQNILSKHTNGIGTNQKKHARMSRKSIHGVNAETGIEQSVGELPTSCQFNGVLLTFSPGSCHLTTSVGHNPLTTSGGDNFGRTGTPENTPTPPTTSRG